MKYYWPESHVIDRLVRRSNKVMLYFNAIICTMIVGWTAFCSNTIALHLHKLEPSSLAIVLIIFVGFFISFWNIGEALKRQRNIYEHPIYKQLQTFGDGKRIAADIEVEALNSEKVLKTKNLLITQNWCIFRNFWSANIADINELERAEKQIAQRNYPEYRAHFFFKSTHYRIIDSESEVERVLEGVFARLPWTLLGYQDDRRALWKQSPERAWKDIGGKQKLRALIDEQYRTENIKGAIYRFQTARGQNNSLMKVLSENYREKMEKIASDAKDSEK